MSENHRLTPFASLPVPASGFGITYTIDKEGGRYFIYVDKEAREVPGTEGSGQINGAGPQTDEIK
jgi:hypothetical protein